MQKIETKAEKRNPQEEAQSFRWNREFDSSSPIDRDLLGNKGASLAEMVRLGLPVPPGFTLTTEAWRSFDASGQLSKGIWQEVLEQLQTLEKKTGKTFGGRENPLLVSVRSGARYSMPGMMETILNVGLNQETKKGLTNRVGKDCAADSYQRLTTAFERITGQEPPQNPYQQLRIAIETVFFSWNNPQAKIYRKYNGIPEDAGTAVTIQEMVFGNIHDRRSGTGVFFTRDPRTGEKKPGGEYLFAGQGEDVVQEKRKTQEVPPKLTAQLEKYGRHLENHCRAPQDIEFTVEKGQLFLLQSRTLQGTPLAKVKMAIDFFKEGLITQKETYQRVTPADIQTILRPSFEPKALEKARKDSLVGQGKPASIGAAVGLVVFTPEEARELGEKGEPVVLICPKLDPNDVETFFYLEALVTTLGGTASHMALISQALGKVVVVSVEFKKKPKKGDLVSINGATGEVFTEEIPLTKTPTVSEDIRGFIKEWKKAWGESSWISALYPTEKKYSRQTLLKRIEEITPELEQWSSRKAQTTILLNNLIPQDQFIQSVVLKPDDIEGIRKALEGVAKKEKDGFQNIPRSCHCPEKLTGAPWVVIPTSKDINRFLNDPNFPGKYGGLPKWREDQSLAGIIIPAEPEGKLDPSLAPRHFAFTISCFAFQPSRVVVDLLLETPHLRRMEETSPSKLIQIIANLNMESPYYLGEIEVVFGRDYQNDPYAQKVVQILKEKIFGEWWRPPFALPHVVSALDETYGLSTLEVQGRMKDKKELAWCLIYGAKGREEKEKATEMIW